MMLLKGRGGAAGVGGRVHEHRVDGGLVVDLLLDGQHGPVRRPQLRRQAGRPGHARHLQALQKQI